MLPRDTTIYPFDLSDVAKRRGRLPHWEVSKGVYFVTFRLFDSIPDAVLSAYLNEQKDLLAALEKSMPEERALIERDLVRLYCTRIDRCLDVGLGRSEMKDPEKACAVAQSIRHYDRQRWDLFAWVVMPNHVHLLLRPLGETTISKAMHSIKGFSAHTVNAMSGRRGTFWQKEYFDHLLRSQLDLRRFARYIVENPRKAGLRDWPWVWVCEELGDVLTPSG